MAPPHHQGLSAAEDLKPTVARIVWEHRVDHDDSAITISADSLAALCPDGGKTGVQVRELHVREILDALLGAVQSISRIHDRTSRHAYRLIVLPPEPEPTT